MQERTVFVKPSLEYKRDAIRFMDECLELDGVVHGGGGLDICSTYEKWLIFLQQKQSKETVPEGYVVSETWFAVPENDDKIIGIVDIRKELNEKLSWGGGNIGLAVRPHMRGEGHGKELLSMALERCKELGMGKVLLTCEEENLRAAKTILSCKAIEEINAEAMAEGFRRFWVTM
ncbi:MAG: GNAT family N-acetyltransferase [bacterium]|nr:GNAT family N-acetyltransferase [bacterium]